MKKKSNQTSVLEEASKAIQSLLNGEVHEDFLNIKYDESTSSDLIELVDNLKLLMQKYSEGNEFINALANGKLSNEPPKKNFLISSFKQLHSNLHHLTWQLQRVAEGDYNQKVSFLGEFSESFNNLISSLKEKARLENALSKSEERYRQLVEFSPDAVYVHIDGKFVFTNKAGAILLGASKPEELYGKPILGVVHPDYRDTVTNRVKDISSNNIAALIEEKFIRLDGKVIDVEVIGRQITFQNQQAVQVIARDITERKKFDEALRLNQVIMSNMDEGVALILSSDGSIVYTNPKFERMFGYNHDEIIGKHISIVNASTESSPQQIADGISELLKTSGSWEGEVKNIKKDGTFFYSHASVSTFNHSEFGKVWIAVHHDISESKKAAEALKESEKKYRKIFENIQDIFFQTDRQGKIIEISPSIERYSGFTYEELIGKQVEEVYFYPADRLELLKAIHEKKEVVDFEIRLKTKDQREVYTSCNAHFLLDSEGNVAGVEGSLRDITERKRSEESKVNLLKDLELSKQQIQKEVEKLVHLNIQLANSEEKLKELNAEKDKFFSIIAHDLKSPFQGLLGYSQILSNEYHSLSEEEKIEFISGIEELSKSAFQLLENLLQWSRIQTGRMVFNPDFFNLIDELNPTIELLQQAAKNKGVIVECLIDKKIFVTADINMIQTVVRNLISNGIKFTKPGGKVVVSSKKLENVIEVSVTDSGVGIKKEDLGNLFKIDKTVSSKGTANEEGTGLGLILCKEMIQKHKGKIWAESELGKGSRFSFTIPKQS